MQITNNFFRWEFTASRTASKLGIDNSIPYSLMGNITILANWLQTLRDRLCKHYGREIYINISSGYRCLRLNREVKGSSSSAHLKGFAADITATTISPYELTLFIKNHMMDCPFDQVILEYDSWVHIGLSSPEKMRNSLLEAVSVKNILGKMETSYIEFNVRECQEVFCEY